VANGNVSERKHKDLPLVIFNYTPQCQYARIWDDVTKKCRGLVVNSITGEIVARPFEKFFNWDESGSPYPPSGPALRMPKMDGSLGILVATDFSSGTPTKELIATRGSFHSEQAEWATMHYHEVVAEMANILPPSLVFSPVEGKTYLFEIIYPDNRIVVDYGDYEGLMLIDVIDNATGFSDTDEFDNCQWEDKVIRKPIVGFDSGQAVDIPDGDEGFVYLWPTRNFRTKMKAAEYVRIHRLVSGLTEKSIWQHLVNGGTLNELKRDLPEEFHDFIDKHGKDLQFKAAAIVSRVYMTIDLLERKFGTELKNVPRKDVAIAIQKDFAKDAKYLFAALDGKQVFPLALAAVKPQREVSLVKED
jgi:RNA ligase